MKKQTKHKQLLVKEIRALTLEYAVKVDSLSSVFKTTSQKKQISIEISQIENELEQKLFLSMQMKGF